MLNIKIIKTRVLRSLKALLMPCLFRNAEILYRRFAHNEFIALLNKTKEHLKQYSEIHLFLDNDLSGTKCKNDILKNFPKRKTILKSIRPIKI
jgi:5S rRNA maturation endonuclease (ribonuclease M5)